MAKKKKSLLVSLTPSILALAIGGYTIYSFGGDIIKSAFETEVLNGGYATVKEYDDSENVESEVISNSENEITEEVEETNEIKEEEPVVEEIPEPVILPEEQDSYLLDNGYQFLDIDFEGLNEKNTDVVGYIQIPNTNISFTLYF